MATTEKLSAEHGSEQNPCDMEQMPKPTEQHGWLERFVGEWDAEVQMFMQPDQPPMTTSGSEVCRMVGGFWMVGDGSGSMGEMPYAHRITLGYDPGRGKYIGTWIDSMMSYMWQQEGELDDAGNTLTMRTEGPCPMSGKTLQFREVTEFKSADHRLFTSFVQQDDGSWQPGLIVNFKRRK